MGIVKLSLAIMFCVVVAGASAMAAECEGDCGNGRGIYFGKDGKKLYEGQFKDDYPLER